MDNDLILNQDNVVRHCLRKHIDEDGDITSAAFKLRHERSEEYLSVMWLEYFSNDTIEKKLESARYDLRKRRSLSNRDRLAVLNVGVTRTHVMSNIGDRRNLEFKHKPGLRNNSSHSGIFNIEPNGDEVAELLVESIAGAWPAVP